MNFRSSEDYTDDDEASSNPADLGVFDHVIRHHVMLKPMVSLVQDRIHLLD